MDAHKDTDLDPHVDQHTYTHLVCYANIYNDGFADFDPNSYAHLDAYPDSIHYMDSLAYLKPYHNHYPHSHSHEDLNPYLNANHEYNAFAYQNSYPDPDTYFDSVDSPNSEIMAQSFPSR